MHTSHVFTLLKEIRHTSNKSSMSSSAFSKFDREKTNWADALDSETNKSDPEIFLEEKFQSILSKCLAPLGDAIATLNQKVTHLQKTLDKVNQQNGGKTTGYVWNTKNSDSVKALNWIVRQIQKEKKSTGSYSILPAKLGLKWKSDFPDSLPIWQTQKKPDGRKKGVKAFVTECGNGILSVEDTTNHMTKKILFNA